MLCIYIVVWISWTLTEILRTQSSALFRSIAWVIFVTASTKMTKFQQVIMLLMKPRMNLPLFDLAFCFKVSESIVSCTFSRLVITLDKKFTHWPTIEPLTRTMPSAFIKIMDWNLFIYWLFWNLYRISLWKKWHSQYKGYYHPSRLHIWWEWRSHVRQIIIVPSTVAF